MENPFDPLDPNDKALPIVELTEDAPEEIKFFFSKLVPGSVAVAKWKGEKIEIHYEGGIYQRKNTDPTKEEREQYAITAAGRAKENYPTVAKFLILTSQARYLKIIGVVQMMWKPWTVLWIEPRKIWGCPCCNPGGYHEYEDEYICSHNGGPCA